MHQGLRICPTWDSKGMAIKEGDMLQSHYGEKYKVLFYARDEVWMLKPLDKCSLPVMLTEWRINYNQMEVQI